MLRDGKVWQPNARPAQTILKDITTPKFCSRPGARLAAQEAFRDRLTAAASASKGANRPSTLAELAERVEATDRFASPYFGALHNDGHLHFSLWDSDEGSAGVMFSEMTAVRDPIFYRWHEHLDAMMRAYQDKCAPNEFDDEVPVEVESIALASLGHEDAVKTRMRWRPLFLPLPPGVGVPGYRYLAHDGYEYRIRIRNMTNRARQVTMRVFMAPEEHIDDRKAWIEMDKFCHLVSSEGVETVVRHSRHSSVVRHPVLTTDILEGETPWPDEAMGGPGCKCGWPYTLLLPRGKPAGAAYRLFVMLTPGEDIVKPDALQAGSNASYCGLVDEAYPDRKAMGYPFDRPFSSPIASWIEGPAQPKEVGSARITVIHDEQEG